VIPKPLAWGIVIVLTALEALNVVAAIFVKGYQSDALVHFAFTSIVGFMMGMKEGGGVVSRALTAVRNITNPPPVPPADPAVPPADQEPMP
jgi:hypothetical protein